MSPQPSILKTANEPARLQPPSRPDLALGLIAAFAIGRLLLQFVTVAITPYEIHRDEFLYLSMGEHLRLWGMDFPPAIAILANTARGFFGDTLFAVRFFPAVAGTAIVVLGALLAREFGGGRVAQGIAMLALCGSPLFLRPASLFQPVVLDQLWWTAGLFALAKIAHENRTRWWVLLGLAGGFGLLTKFSILFFAFGVFVAFLITKQRRLLATSGPWLSVVIALVLGSPTIIGQLRLHLPVIIHMTDLRNQQLNEHFSTMQFLSGQVWMLGPALLLAVAGLVFLVRNAEFRALGLACIAAFLELLLLHGKAYYIGPIYPALFAAGAAALAHFRGRARFALQGLTISILALAGAIILPMGLPILPPEIMARYSRALGVTAAVTTNRGTVLPLPQDYADMLGWDQQVQAVAAVFASLPLEKQAKAWLVARNYGEAGALEFYGPRHGLPRRIMLPNNFLLWPANPCATIATIGIKPKDLEKFFKSVKVVTEFDHPWMVEEERNRAICIAEDPIRNLGEAWVKRTGW